MVNRKIITAMPLPYCEACIKGEGGQMGPPWRELYICQTCPFMTTERLEEIPSLEDRAKVLLAKTTALLTTGEASNGDRTAAADQRTGLQKMAGGGVASG